jgi:hypothetical protein
MSEDTEVDQGRSMDLAQAAVIMKEARARARQELEVRRSSLLAVWGATLLVCYGILWLAVRSQKPYHGFGGVLPWVLLLTFFSACIRAGILYRALSGVGGSAARQWSHFLIALPAGTAALWIEAAALHHAGASRPVIGVLVAAAPMVSMGLVFCASSAATSDWSGLALGVWLLAVAAGGTWAGPATILAVYALAGGGGFFLVAVTSRWVGHP